ncbi:MAG: sulfatase-like hydrolase/transferase [Lentisphaeria bacterium]|nr:sulfatase-like hydrolase/transferase [Lentisphaeria bacterium]
MKKLFLPFCFLLCIFLLAVNLYFRHIMLDETPWSYPWLATLNDLALPSVLFLMMLFHNRRIWLVLYALTLSFMVLLKVVNVILYSQIMEILSYANCSLLWTHTSFETLQILYGSFWYGKAIGILLVICIVPAVLIFSGIRYFKEYDRFSTRAEYSKAVMLVFLLGTLLSNWYYTCYSEMIGKSYFRREFLVRPALVQIQDFVHDYCRSAKEQIKPENQVRCGFEPEHISPDSGKLLKQWGLLPFRREWKGKTYDFRKIIVIAAESLNLDYLRTYNPEMPEGLTPFLDKMCREYVSFSNYFTASQPTSWALDSIFLSRMDYEADLKGKPVSICDLFRKNGWKTFYFSPTTEMCFAQGRDYPALFRFEKHCFQEQIFRKSGLKGTCYWGLSDSQLFSVIPQILEEENADKFFCVISTIDLHDPYTVSGPAASWKSTGNLFLDSLRATDRNLQSFVEEIMARPWFDEKTLLVITADHSATFGVNYTKRKTFFPARIPLILITKNNVLKQAFSRCDRYGSQIDLAPTLLGLLGMNVPDSFMGQDLRSGKNFAFAKTVDMMFLHLPDGRSFQYLQTRKPVTPEERALKEFFDVYYSRGVVNDKK